MAKTRTPKSAGLEAGDVLVIFGITGDLAKVMTFHSGRWTSSWSAPASRLSEPARS
jgi:hypothetical protein